MIRSASIFSLAFILLAAVMGVPTPARSGEDGFQSLDDGAIRQTLSDRTLVFTDGARQYFGTDGALVHVSLEGEKEEGKWKAEDDAMCSRYEGDGFLWTCFKVKASGKHVELVSVESGASFPGKLFKGKMLY